MRYSRFEPLDRDLSLLVLGTAWFGEETRDAAYALLDEWVALGGNALDSAREYGARDWGESETLIGRWVRERGRRSDVVIGTKGGHFRVVGEPRVNPAAIREGLEANAYAAANGLEGFTFASLNLALARQNEPPWPGALSISAPEERARYAELRLPLFAWSAQAQGWFSGRYSPDADVARVYDGEGNRDRRRRAEELARTKGSDANGIALAWVLHQPFPTWALVGPRTVEELRASVAALDVTLSDEEARWLDLEED